MCAGASMLALAVLLNIRKQFKDLLFQIHSKSNAFGRLNASYVVITQAIVETPVLESVATGNSKNKKLKEIDDGHSSRIHVRSNSRSDSPTGRRSHGGPCPRSQAGACGR